MKRPKVIISLAVFPCQFKEEYQSRADHINNKLFELQSRVVTCRKNGLGMRLNECIDGNGTMTRIAQQQLNSTQFTDEKL
jgi:hypothetical protein